MRCSGFIHLTKISGLQRCYWKSAYQTKETQASVLVRFLKFSNVCKLPLKKKKKVVLFFSDLIGFICLIYNMLVQFHFFPLHEFKCCWLRSAEALWAVLLLLHECSLWSLCVHMHIYLSIYMYICTFFSCVADWPHRRTAREERGLSSVLCAHSVRLVKTKQILNLSIAHSSCKTGFLAKANAAASL